MYLLMVRRLVKEREWDDAARRAKGRQHWSKTRRAPQASHVLGRLRLAERRLGARCGGEHHVVRPEARGAGLVAQINVNLWHEEAGIYVNKNWQTNSWVENSQKGDGLTIAPTNFYPMIAGAPTDAQVERMLSRWLTNTSEFAVILIALVPA